MRRSDLRSFLNLGARMRHDGVPASDVERQEDTVLETLRLLEAQPGVVLADEVGMGKTFEALGVVAASLHRKPGSKTCVVTPGPDLNRKWIGEISNFSDAVGRIYDFGDRAGAASTLGELIDVIRQKSIAVVPVSAFSGARGGRDQAYLLSLFARWQQLHGTTTNALFRRFRNGALERIDPKHELFLDRFDLALVEPLAEAAFAGEKEEPGLAEIYSTGGVDAFEIDEPVRRALDRARFRLVRALLPEIDLLVIDEAHKLKNPESLRHRGVATVFERKYGRALFLTATPFQLDISELRQVFSLFARARESPTGMEETVDGLFSAIADYQHHYDQLEAMWRTLDAAQVALLTSHYASDPELEALPPEISLGPVIETIRTVRDLKRGSIEPGFRRWMVRSIHQEKRAYRRHVPETIEPGGESLLPFLVYERFIAELFRTGDSTHKAAVEVNMVSSFEAAASGALFAKDREMEPSADAYRGLLREVLGDKLGDHPKVESVVHDAIAHAERGEKTLIFCGRTETISRLAKQISGVWEGRVIQAWRRVYPGADEEEIFGTRTESQRERGRIETIRERLHRTQDLLYIALRERYLHTLVPAATEVIGHEDEIAARATELLHGLRVGATAAGRVDYQLAKRCIERAVVERWCVKPPPAQFANLARAMTSDDFLRYGIDLVPDALEGDGEGSIQPTWMITAAIVEAVVSDRPHLWQTLAGSLDRILLDSNRDMALRVKVVERLARYLTRRDVLFLPELLLAAASSGLDVESIQSHEMVEFIDLFWTRPEGRAWIERIREFLRYFVKRPLRQRHEIIDGPIAQGEFVRHTVDSENREGLREAFNTPLNPMVLIANEVMQEGLDLHHNCRRIVHHDLAWNPAQLEQRVGRIDRIGSLIRRLREGQPDETLDIKYPLVARTIDERMYRTVKMREKWLEFLLGARPDFNEYALEQQSAPLPPGLAESLVIDLRPPRAPD